LSQLSKRLDDCQRLLVLQGVDADRELQRAETASMRLEDFMASCSRAWKPQSDSAAAAGAPSPVALPSIIFSRHLALMVGSHFDGKKVSPRVTRLQRTYRL
ncbi:hypothetical protein Pmar_PMAR001750, partial [Perkinsus marinus ATCC 50983]